jgi:hypothetical protein
MKITLTILGISIMLASGVWSLIDYAALIAATQNFNQVVRQGGTATEILVAAHKENNHRLNLAAEGCWFLLAAILVVNVRQKN